LDLLESTTLEPGEDKITHNLRLIYQKMVEHGFVTETELPLLDAWLEDLATLGINS